MKKTLVIEAVSSPVASDGTSSKYSVTASEQGCNIRYQDPVELLQFITAERMGLVKLLLEAGPLSEEQIAARTGRDEAALKDDLRILLAREALTLNEDYEYCFDYEGVRVTLYWPLSTANTATQLVTDSGTQIDAREVNILQPNANTPDPNPAVAYALRIVHILLGIVLVFILIDVVMYLAAR